MKKKNFLCGILLAISTLCMVLGVACTDNGLDKTDSEFSENLTFSAELNESFSTPYVFEDYKYSIEDKNGNPVTLANGSFLCDTIGDYTIVVEKDGKSYEFPLYVRDTKKPLFAGLISEVVVGVENSMIDLDDYFSATDNSGEVSIVYQVERNGIENVEVDEQGELFLQYGFYNVLAIATDSSGNTAEQFLTIQVKETKVFDAEDVMNSSCVFIETPRFSYNYNEVAIEDALKIDTENNGFVWQLNTNIDAWSNQFIMIDTEEIFGSLAEDIDTVIFKIKLGNAFQSNDSKNWVEFYNYYKDKDVENSVELIEGDWIPSSYGDLTYSTPTAMLSGMEAETVYEIALTRAVNDKPTSYLVIRVRCSIGEDGTYNYAPTLSTEQNDGLAHDYTISLYDFTACANVFRNEYVAFGPVEVDNEEQTVSWDRVANAVSYQIRVGSFDICSDEEIWTDIGNVTSYDLSSFGMGNIRYAVRAVLESGYTAASIGVLRIPTMTELFFSYAQGSLSTGYTGDYSEYDNATSIVTLAGKQAIRLDFLSDSQASGRRALIIDLQEIFGDDITNIASVSFNYYFGTGFTSGKACMVPSNFSQSNHNTPYVKENLFLIEGVQEDHPSCYDKSNCTWYSMSLMPQESGLSRYIVLMIDFDAGGWFSNYTADISDGTLDNDYSVYFSDFVVTYK